MSKLVDPGEIERIVGARRHSVKHIGRVVTAENTTYVLHSKICKDSGEDLRECHFSIAMDESALRDFDGYCDRTVVVAIDSMGFMGPAEVIDAEQPVGWPDYSEDVEYLEPLPSSSGSES